MLVEHYLRKGMKQLEILQSGNVQVSLPVRLATSESLLVPRARSDHSICRGLAFSRARGLGRERERDRMGRRRARAWEDARGDSATGGEQILCHVNVFYR